LKPPTNYGFSRGVKRQSVHDTSPYMPSFFATSFNLDHVNQVEQGQS
jgi:hypothetical protein